MTTAKTVAPVEVCRANVMHLCSTAPLDLHSMHPDSGKYSKQNSPTSELGQRPITNSTARLWR